MADDGPQYIEDHHILHFRLDRDEITIAYVECPFEGKTALCNRFRDHCVIDTFVGVYGAECNQGSCPIEGPTEIAWLPVSGESDLDNEFGAVWILPIDDVDYRAYKMLSQNDS